MAKNRLPEHILRKLLARPRDTLNPTELHELDSVIMRDLDLVMNYAKVVICLSQSGDITVHHSENIHIDIVALIGPAPHDGKNYPTILLEEVGLHKTFPFERSRYKLPNGTRRAIVKRCRLASLSPEQYNAVAPIVMETLHDITDDMCLGWESFRSGTTKTLGSSGFPVRVPFMHATTMLDSPFSADIIRADYQYAVSDNRKRAAFLKIFADRLSIKRMLGGPIGFKHSSRLYIPDTRNFRYAGKMLRFTIQPRTSASEQRVPSYAQESSHFDTST